MALTLLAWLDLVFQGLVGLCVVALGGWGVCWVEHQHMFWFLIPLDASPFGGCVWGLGVCWDTLLGYQTTNRLYRWFSVFFLLVLAGGGVWGLLVLGGLWWGGCL
jgi:hypothetical protein